MNTASESLPNPDPTQPAPSAADPGDEQATPTPELQTPAAQLAEISRLIRGEEPPTEPTAPPAPGTPPRNLEELAQALQVDAKALYDLEVPMRADGERVKLGALKDYYAKDEQHRLDQVSWTEQKSREQAELTRTRAELHELLRAVPAEKLNKDVLEAVRRRVDANVSQERRRLLERVPEWQDEDRQATERAGIAEHLADFGIPAEVLQGVTDHRILAYMRDNWLRKSRLDQALAKVQRVSTPSHPKSGSPGKAPAKPVRFQGGARTVDHQVDQISRLLKGN